MMRRIHIAERDFALFHQDISPTNCQFFLRHTEAFKTMWAEQTKQFWVLFVELFEQFIWVYGVMKDCPLKIDDSGPCVEEIISVIIILFVDGSAISANTLVKDCAVVSKNRHLTDKTGKMPYAQNPFFMRDTRETFRKLFGIPNSKATLMKFYFGLPVYVKFAGAVVSTLRRWLNADTIEDKDCIDEYLSQLSLMRSTCYTFLALEATQRMLTREKRMEEAGQSPTKRVEDTKQKALEWADTSKSSVATELEEFDPPKEKPSYRSEYNKMMESFVDDVQDLLVDSITEMKMKEIRLAQEKGEDYQPIIEELKENIEKRIKPRRKKRRGGGGGGGIARLLEFHKELSSSDRYLEAVGAKRPPDSLLQLSVTETTDGDKEPDILIGGGEGDNGKRGADGGDTTNGIHNEAEEESVDVDKKCQNGSNMEKITETGEDSVTAVEPEAAIETEKENMEDNAVTHEKERYKDTSVASSQTDEIGVDTKGKQLHVCYCCKKKEELAKTFKRCIKCRGKHNPHYYCSRECQANDWKAGHYLDHKDEVD